MSHGVLFQLPRKLDQSSVTPGKEGTKEKESGTRELNSAQTPQKRPMPRVNLLHTLSSKLFLHEADLYKEGRAFALS